MDVKSVLQKQIYAQNNYAPAKKDPLNSSVSPIRSKNGGGAKTTTTTTTTMTSSIRSKSAPKQFKDAHEVFRDRIINGRDINDVEEELNAVKAKSMKSDQVIKMKEDQIEKYKKGLERAKKILKDMVGNTQVKMKKLQDDVDVLQQALKSSETTLRKKTQEVITLERELKGDGRSKQSLIDENNNFRNELEKYRSHEHQQRGAFEDKMNEKSAKNRELYQSNHRLQNELSNVNAKLQQKMKETLDKSSEIEALHFRIMELEGGTSSLSNSKEIAIIRLQQQLSDLERTMANKQKEMEDVEFFVSVKNLVDDYLQDANATVEARVDQDKESIYIPPLKCKPSFEALMNTEVDKLPEAAQNLNREIEEDRVNCRRALKELQSKAYIMGHSMDEVLENAKNHEKQVKSITDNFDDIDAALAKISENVQKIEVYGDERDQTHQSENDLNSVLSGFSRGEKKRLLSLNRG